MDEVKKAFQKVKEDISILSDSIKEIREHLIYLHEQIKLLSSSQKNKQTNPQTHSIIPADKQTTNNPSVEVIPTHNLPSKPLKDQFSNTSIGNEGVPADRQQTDNRQTTHLSNSDLQLNLFENTSQLLNSLDDVKKSLRRQFKQLTDQEFLVFSKIYELSDSNQPEINYTLLATTLNLTESSIRDYIARLIKKNIPIEKHKINNKKVNIIISPNLKKLANLSTIMTLRDL